MVALLTGGYKMKNKHIIPVLAVLSFLVHGVSSVSVIEGDSFTLHTGVEVSQKDRIKWYFEGVLITEITGDQSKICTAEECKEVTERFRDRLKLDHQTGSLTITNTRTTDSGEYTLTLSGAKKNNFFITVQGVSAAERREVKGMEKSVKEGESVTLDPGVKREPKDVLMWYFNDTLITEITGDQSQICTDDQCKERFRDRLKLDHVTGSLTITNTRNTDSGEYTVNKSNIHPGPYSSSIITTTILKIFNVTVTNSGPSADSGPSVGYVAGIVVVVAVLLVLAVGGVIYYLHRKSKSINDEKNEQELLNEDQE